MPNFLMFKNTDKVKGHGKKYKDPKFDAGDQVINYIECGFTPPPSEKKVELGIHLWETVGKTPCTRFINYFVE